MAVGLSLSALVTATLIAVFIYWGWDTAVSINEETSDPEKTPGRAAIISTVLLLVTYATVSVATVAFAGTGDTDLGPPTRPTCRTCSPPSARRCSARASSARPWRSC